DHPPLHFWIVGAVAKLAHSEAAPVVRFPFVLCFAGTTWFSWRIGRRFFGERAALIGAILLNVSAVFSLSTGGCVLPDGPLMLCTTAAVDVIAGILFDGELRGATNDERRKTTDKGRATSGVRSTSFVDRSSPRLLAWSLAGLLTGLA